ncbi:MAG TPA: hypothetical protein VJP79_12095 [Nitrososphaera sp.]|nr:hypothetical protein [Nitrososphaera sp.]
MMETADSGSANKEIIMTDDNNNNNNESDEVRKVYKETHIKRQEQGTEVHVMTSEEEDLTAKARRAASAVEDLITSAIDRAKVATKEKAESLVKSAEQGPGAASAAADSRDISKLGPLVEGLARTFEDTMTDIRKQEYDEQERLLQGYRKLLEEQINVINSRIQFAKRVK